MTIIISIFGLFAGLGFLLAIGTLAVSRRRLQIGYLIPVLNIFFFTVPELMRLYLTYFTTKIVGIKGSGVGLVGGYGAASKFIDTTYPYNLIQIICIGLSTLTTLYLIIKLRKPLYQQ